MSEREFLDEPMETDHIWPKAEGGPDEPYNKRRIPRSENRHKSAKMPSVFDVLDSNNPGGLGADIDIRSLRPFNHPSNKSRGFGGRPKR